MSARLSECRAPWGSSGWNALLYCIPLHRAPKRLRWVCRGGLTSHKHKQAKDDADNRQQAERRNTTTAKDILYKCAFLQLYLLYAFGRRVYLKWHSSFIGSCIPRESNHDLALLFELLCHMDWFLFNLTDFPLFFFITLYDNILGNILLFIIYFLLLLKCILFVSIL